MRAIWHDPTAILVQQWEVGKSGGEGRTKSSKGVLPLPFLPHPIRPDLLETPDSPRAKRSMG